MTIYRTVVTVEVFSNGPFPVIGDIDMLAEVNYAITEGPCIGDVDISESVPVPDAEVRDHLLRIGNDGTFFDDPLPEENG